MIKTIFLFFIFLMTGLKSFSADLFLPRLMLENHRLKISNLSPATEIYSVSNMVTSAFDSDLKNCELGKKQIADSKIRLANFFTNQLPRLLLRLDSLGQARLQERKIHVLFQDLEQVKMLHRMYSYQTVLNQTSYAFIWIDCQEIKKPKGLEAAIAHEFSHLMLANLKHESWFEESVAQIIEEEAGGLHPSLISVKALENEPNLTEFAANGPLVTNAQYGLAFLWAKSIIADFKSFSPIQFMIQPGPKECEENSNYLERLICRSQMKMRQDQILQAQSNKMTIERINLIFNSVLQLPSEKSILSDPWLWKGRQ